MRQKEKYQGVYGQQMRKPREDWSNAVAAVFLLAVGMVAGGLFTAFIFSLIR